MKKNGKYFFIPDSILQENSQTIHAYIYILSEINNSGGEFITTKNEIAKTLNTTERQVSTILNKTSDKYQIDIRQMLKKGTSITINFIGVVKDFKTPKQPTQKTASKPPLEKRKETFVENLKKFSNLYDKDTLNDFYRYWVETDQKEQKMRFEFQKTWNINLRLITWQRNSQKQFAKNNNPAKPKEEKIGRTSIETIKKNAEYNGEY